MRNQTHRQTKHPRWPLSESYCSPQAQRSDADPADANALHITRADSANGSAPANSITIQNYGAGQLELELFGMAHEDNSCHRWSPGFAPKKIAAHAHFMSARGRFGWYSRPALGHAIAGEKSNIGCAASLSGNARLWNLGYWTRGRHLTSVANEPRQDFV